MKRHRVKDFMRNISQNMSMGLRLMLLCIAIIVPMLVLNIFSIYKVKATSDSYSRILDNIKLANDTNLNFEGNINTKMYAIIIGKRDADKEGVYALLEEAKLNVEKLTENTMADENRTRIAMVSKDINILEKHIDQIMENVEVGGFYDENISIWENSVQGMTALFDEHVRQYTYYEIKSTELIRAQADANVQSYLTSGVISLLLIIIIALILSRLISNSITRPVNQLCETTHLVAKGDFEVRAKQSHTNEIQTLSDSMNDMIVQIGRLVEDIKEEQLKLRDTELKLLQAQINPHFLYNTLDAIVWLAEAEDNKRVVEMVNHLSDFFRSSLSKGLDFVSLKEEEAHIRSYLQIQQFRYSDIMDYEIDIHKELEDYKILKLTLQPIVENALYHGIKNKRGKGKIKITSAYNEDTVVLNVEDNGRGMTKEELEKLIISIENKEDVNEKAGFGLANVNQRIKLKHGPKYGIKVKSEIQKGTQVEIILPYASCDTVLIEGVNS